MVEPLRSATPARTPAISIGALSICAAIGGVGCGGGPPDDVPWVDTGGSRIVTFENSVPPSVSPDANGDATGRNGVPGAGSGAAGFAGGAGIPGLAGVGGAGFPGGVVGGAGVSGVGGFGGGGVVGDAFDGVGFFDGAGTGANLPPIASFVIDPQCLADLQTDVALVSTSSDPDGDALTCVWVMPAGIPSDADGCSVAGVSFLAANDSPITLRVDDGRGGVAMLTRELGPCSNLASGQPADMP
jgi:hypothetical protein